MTDSNQMDLDSLFFDDFNAHIFKKCLEVKLGPLTYTSEPGGYRFRDKFNRQIAVSNRELRFNATKDRTIALVKARLFKKRKPQSGRSQNA